MFRVHDRGSAHGRDYGNDHDYDHERFNTEEWEVPPVDTTACLSQKSDKPFVIRLRINKFGVMVMNIDFFQAARRRLKELIKGFLSPVCQLLPS